MINTAPIALGIFFLPSNSLIAEILTAPNIPMKIILAAVATILRSNNATKIMLIIPDNAIALVGTLVFGLIFEIATGITFSCESI